MDTDVVAGLQKQFNHERLNAQKYFFIADMMSNLAYDGFAKFFRSQAEKEIGHAKVIGDFLISKRENPRYDLIPIVQMEFTVPGMVKEALITEVGTTQALKDLYRVCDDAGDYQACAVIDTLLLEQVEEESWATDLVDLVKSADATGWLILDEKYGK